MTALNLIHSALLRAHNTPVVERRGKWFTGKDILERVYARLDDFKANNLCKHDKIIIIVNDNLIAIEQMLACWIIGASVLFVDFRTPYLRIEEWKAELGAKVVGSKPITGLTITVQPLNPEINQNTNRTIGNIQNNLAVFFTSSGSTGKPKIIPLTQENLETSINHTIQKIDWDRPGAALSCISISYSASMILWLTRLTIGQPVVSMDIVHRIVELDQNLQRTDVSEVKIPPSQVRHLLNHLKGISPYSKPRYPHITNFTVAGGTALDTDKHEAVMSLCQNFSMTYSAVGHGEISRISGNEILRKPASVGKVTSRLTVEIMKGKELCKPGEIGEISISSEFYEDKRPGDVGWFDEDGDLFITGRVKGLMCRNGVNFSSEKIVKAAMMNSNVLNSIALSRPQKDGSDKIFLLVEAKERVLENIWTTIRAMLPPVEYPDEIICLSHIPIMPSGKIDAMEVDKTLNAILGNR